MATQAREREEAIARSLQRRAWPVYLLAWMLTAACARSSPRAAPDAGAAADGGEAAASFDAGEESTCQAARNGVDAGECPAVDCDYRNITCHRVAPTCPSGLIPSVADGCYGPCTRDENCACSDAQQCPAPGSYVCDRVSGRCRFQYI